MPLASSTASSSSANRSTSDSTGPKTSCWASSLALSTEPNTVGVTKKPSARSPSSAVAAGEQLAGAALHGAGDHVEDPVAVGGVDHGTHLDAVVERPTDADRARHRDHLVGDFVVDRLVHEQARGEHAALPGDVGERRPAPRSRPRRRGRHRGTRGRPTCRRARARPASACPAAAAMMRRAVTPPPVKLILPMRRSDTSAAPASGPPGTTLSTPGGMPAWRQSSANRSGPSAARSAGLRTTVFPAAKAGATFIAADTMPPFHGVSTAITPYGSGRCS